MYEYIKLLSDAIERGDVKERERLFKDLNSLGMDRHTALILAIEIKDD